MKKIYALLVVCLAFASAVSAQNYTWTGATDNNWKTVTNWTPSTGYPHLATDNATFSTSGSTTVTLTESIDLNSLTVSGGAIVKITATVAPNTVTLHSTNAASPGLKIASASSLENDAVTGSGLTTTFVDNGQASIAGTWILSGNADLAPVNYILPASGASTRINVTGKIVVGPNGYIEPNDGSDPENYLVFAAGSALELQTSTPYIPTANYNAASSILINGATNQGVVVDDDNIGNLTYNCPTQSTAIYLGLADMDIRGNLTILNTNNQELTLMSNIDGQPDPILTVWGNVSISGNTKVVESKLDANNTGETRTLSVLGDFNNSASFNMQTYANNAIKQTKLTIKGNLVQTAGSFTASSATTNESISPFLVEFNGTSPQTISVSSGTIDNTNNQVTLKINNPSGVTLNSPLTVGRIDFSGATAGILTTSTSNPLTINNASGSSIVVNGPSNNGYVDGPVARRSTSAAPVLFPSGIGGTLRQLKLTPSAAASNTFQVNLKAGNNGVTPTAPVAGLANYYWNITRLAGSTPAIVEMNLVGAVTGASATDTLVPVAFDGTNWLDARGATGTKIFPGTTTSGSLITAVQTTFNAFTIGYAINSALPIHLISFTGKKTQNSVQLAWEVTDNSTPARFEIVKSVDGSTFVSIGSLPGQEGKLQYALTDNSLASGNNYYRLKMYDIDGTVSYSNVIVIMNGTKGVLISSMIPTIVRDRAKLNVSSSLKGNMQLVITDISGRVMQNQLVSVNAGNQEVWLNASSLSVGMFQVTGYINGEKTATFRFIKQ